MRTASRHQVRMLRIPPYIQNTPFAGLMNAVVRMAWKHTMWRGHGVMIINNGRFPTALLADLLLPLNKAQQARVLAATNLEQAQLMAEKWEYEHDNQPLRIFYYEDYYHTTKKAR